MAETKTKASDYFDRGVEYQQQKNLEAAIDCYLHALALQPDMAPAQCNLGACYQAQGKNKESFERYQKAIRIKPDYHHAYNNLGSLYYSNKDYLQAVKAYTLSIKIDPKDPMVFNNCGSARHFLGDYDNAMNDYQVAIALNPRYVDAYSNLGAILQSVGRVDEAILQYEKAIGVDPSFFKAEYNRALAVLQKGDFEHGWHDYECRFNNPERKYYNRNIFPDAKRWQGEKLKGKKIAFIAEQGMGDTIQFLRFGPMLKAHGAKVYWFCQEELVTLCANLPWVTYVDNKISVPEAHDCDYHISTLSVGKYFVKQRSDIPENVPYLFADKKRVKHFKSLFDKESRLRVGVVWAGKPTHGNDLQRSMKIDRFVRLQMETQLAFYSLQKGEPAKQAENSPIINLDNVINDFADTAAIIEHLDLVISIDTSVAHLAGAMGKPVWNLIPFNADWRWWLDIEDGTTPWYPSMRLFHQPKPLDWDSVFQHIALELASLSGDQV